MAKLYKFGISGSVILVCLGWLLNCAALKSADSPTPVVAINPREVIYSDWIPANYWVNTTIFGLPARACELNQTRLTPQKLENGKLYVYTKLEKEVKSLPFTLKSNDCELRFDYIVPPNATLKLVEISIKGSLKPLDNQQFRYILIPNTLENKIRIDMADYAAVEAAFGLAN